MRTHALSGLLICRGHTTYLNHCLRGVEVYYQHPLGLIEVLGQLISSRDVLLSHTLLSVSISNSDDHVWEFGVRVVYGRPG